MHNMRTVEIKAFVPARDFALSKRFYEDLGFTLAWSDDDLACFRHGHSSFLLQNFSQPPDNFMMHLLVEDVDAWWHHVQEQKLIEKYDVKAEPPADRPWGMRDFVIVDPTYVLWRIAENKWLAVPLWAINGHSRTMTTSATVSLTRRTEPLATELLELVESYLGWPTLGRQR